MSDTAQLSRNELAKRIDYSTIARYEIRDADVELACLRALTQGIGTIVVGPSSLPIADSVLRDSEVRIAVAASYPSGAYLLDAKRDEIAELIELDFRIDEVYMVMAAGRFISGHAEQARREIRMFAEVAGDKTRKLVTEAGHLDENQKKELCGMVAEAGIEYLVTSTSFLPYDITLPTPDDVADLVKFCQDTVDIVASADIRDAETALRFLRAGASRIFTETPIDVLSGEQTRS